MATWLSPTNVHPALPETATSTTSAAAGSVLRPCRFPPLFISSFCYTNKTFLSFTPHIHRSIPRSAANRNGWPFRCSSGIPRPQPDPPNTENPPPGVRENMSKAQDTVRIFFAVLFWMSLFFWYSVWDGKNDGRPTKGSRFRR
nr:E3 ubiquitin-protein like [Ipomoea batatas]